MQIYLNWSKQSPVTSLPLLQRLQWQRASVYSNTLHNMYSYSSNMMYCWMHSCLPSPFVKALSYSMQHMDTTAQNSYRRALTTIIISYILHYLSEAKQLHSYLKSKHALLLFLALPFICFSPHFQQIRSQYSCACASPQSGMHLEKASSNSDWRQAGRQRERKWERELRIEWSRRRCMGRGGVMGVMERRRGGRMRERCGGGSVTAGRRRGRRSESG